MEPGLLHGVVRLAQGAEHPVGHRPQVGPVGLELLRQPLVLVHRSHSLVAFRHSSDEGNPTDVTGRPAPEVKDAGGGKLIASVKDADSNIIGLIQLPSL